MNRLFAYLSPCVEKTKNVNGFYVFLLLWVRKEVKKKSVKKPKMVENNLLTAFKRRGNVRVLSICHNWLVSPFTYWHEFYFYWKLSSHISQILNSVHESEHFAVEALWKKLFSFSNWLVGQWSGRPVLTNGKVPNFLTSLAGHRAEKSVRIRVKTLKMLAKCKELIFKNFIHLISH